MQTLPPRAASRPPAIDAEPLLFNDERFHALTLAPGARRLVAEHRDDRGRILGTLAGALEGGAFTSGASAPFGGVDLAGDVRLPDLRALLADALDQLRAAGAEEIRIRARPPFYGPAEPVVHALLHELGFRVERLDLNQHVELRPLRDMDDYLGALKRKRARDVRLDLEGRFGFREAGEDEAAWAAGHALLEAARARRGYRPELALAYLRRLSGAFSDRIRLYLLEHDGRPAAAALVFRVLPGRDLLVSWGEDPGLGLQRSPMNLLAYRLVERSLAGGARTLDLGPSVDPDGAPKDGLFQFKRSVLAVPSTRPTLVWRSAEAT